MLQLSIVVPVYQAEECVEELYRRLKLVLEPLTSGFEIILVDDSSRDNSWQKIVSLASRDQRVKGFQLSRNFGQHYAITAGLQKSCGDWVVVMDCDLQDPPEEIPKLFAKAMEGYDVVLAGRQSRKDSWFRKIPSYLFWNILSFMSGMKHDQEVANFRIIHRKVSEQYLLFNEQLRFFGGIVNWMGFKTVKIPVQHAPRFAGRTSYTWKALMRFGLNVILAYSNRPLYLLAGLGFFISFFSFGYGLYRAISHFFYAVPVTGWTSLIVSIYFLSGTIICTLGVLGVYLGKVFDEVKRRPLYIIGQST
jgi:glycosyltransferase involved in cell wall biosynthesis